MNWFDRILEFLHLLWLEVAQVIRNIWARIGLPLGIYVGVVTALIVITIVVGLPVLITGVVIESNWTIFWGGIILLGGFGIVGVVLLPFMLIVRFLRVIFTLGGHRGTTSALLDSRGSAGTHGSPSDAQH